MWRRELLVLPYIAFSPGKSGTPVIFPSQFIYYHVTQSEEKCVLEGHIREPRSYPLLHLKDMALQQWRGTLCKRCCQRVVSYRRRQGFATHATQPEIYDIVTIGGGPVGLALVAALSMSPCFWNKIRLLHLTRPRILPTHQTPEDRPGRIPTSLSSPRMDSYPRLLFQPGQQPHPGFDSLSLLDRSMAARQPLSDPALRHYASLGQLQQRQDPVRLGLGADESV